VLHYGMPHAEGLQASEPLFKRGSFNSKHDSDPILKSNCATCNQTKRK